MPNRERKRTTKTSRRRANTAVLVVSQDGVVSSRLKQCLHTLGFGNVSAANTHGHGLERFKDRQFSLVFFDVVSTNMHPGDFVQSLRNLDSKILLIAIATEPQIDQVFELLRAGARWFLVQPFTVDSVEEVLVRATEGPPFSEGVLEAADRNAALVGMILNSLENLTTTMHHVRSFPESPRGISSVQSAFEESVELAKTFAEGGCDSLAERIIEACLNRATSASTRLGRVRRKLQRLRDKKNQTPRNKAKPIKGRSPSA